MIRQSAVKIVNVTRDLAEELATMPSWKGERPLQPQRVDMLSGKIADGLFHSPTWALARLGGRVYRVNGQHSSHALAASPCIPTGLEATILEFEVDSERDLADLFGQFDNPQSARRMKEIIHAHAATEDDLCDCSLRALQIILSGIAQANGQMGNVCGGDRAALMHSHGMFIQFARRFAGRKHIMYSAVIAAMYLTWKRDEPGAERFWNLVATEEHPDSSNATRVLARFITGEVAGRIRRGGMRWDRRAVMVKCLHAWNAYWRGHSTSLKYVADAPIPSIA